jgi:hypothetical protein
MRPYRASVFADAAPVDGRGRRSPATMLALNERDALLVEIARRFYGGLSHRETAHRLRYRLLIYRSGSSTDMHRA